MRRAVIWAGLAATMGSVTISGCGGENESQARVVEVRMVDFAFEPAVIEVQRDELVTLRFTNDGTTRHEAVVGDEMFQQGHMDHQHLGGEVMANSVVLEPGQTADINYLFVEQTQVFIGCHVDGHWDQGMKATVTITD